MVPPLTSGGRHLPRVPDVLVLIFTGLGQAMGPFIPLEAQRLGMATSTIGLLLGGQGIAGLIASLAGGAWMGSIGPRRMAFWASVVSMLSLLVLWRWPSVLALGLVLTVVWATSSVVIVAGQTLVLTDEHLSGRDQAVGMHAFYASLGMIIGPLMGAVAVRASGSLGTVFFMAAVACGLAVPVALRAPQRGRVDVGRPSFLAGVLPLSPPVILGLGSVLVAEFTYVAWMTFFPLALKADGHSPEFIGVIFAVHGVALSAVRPGLAFVVARLSRVGVVVTSFVFIAAGLVVAAISRSVPASVATAVLSGIGVGFLFPLTMILVTEGITSDRVARLLGLRFAVVTAGAMLGPSLIGLIASASLPAAMGASAAICALAGGWAILRRSAPTHFLTPENRQ